MYINFKLCNNRGIDVKILPLLQMIQQNRTEDLSEIIKLSLNEDVLKHFNAEGYIEYVKGKTKASTWSETIRLSKKGKDLLEDVQTPIVTDGDLQMRDYLISLYFNNDDEERVVGNKKKIATYIS